MIRNCRTVFFAVAALTIAGGGSLHAQTDRPVAELGGYAVLTMPKGKPRGSLILMAGGDGSLGITADGQITKLAGNQLIRTRGRYAAAGYATLSLDSWGDAAAAVRHMQSIARPVIVVGTSRAATRMHSALPGGPDGMVITSGMLDQFQANVGSSAALPPTLVVHHRWDQCRVSLPALVDPFIAWSNGRARALWLEGGTTEGNPCQGRSYHGFLGLDAEVVSRVVAFAGSVRRR